MKVKITPDTLKLIISETERERLVILINKDEWLKMTTDGSKVIVASPNSRDTIELDPFDLLFLVDDEDVSETFSGENGMFYILKGLERYMFNEDQIILNREVLI